MHGGLDKKQSGGEDVGASVAGMLYWRVALTVGWPGLKNLASPPSIFLNYFWLPLPFSQHFSFFFPLILTIN